MDSWPGAVIARPGIRRRGGTRTAIALFILVLAGCSRHACPDYLVADGLTVDADAFVDAHPQSWKLCATGAPCLVLNASDPRPAVVRLTADKPGVRQVDVTVTARDGTVLLQAGTQVKVRHVVLDARCGKAANLASVSVAADGSLKTG